MDLSHYKIVADSSADLTELEGVSFAAAPLKIVTAQKEYVDDEAVDVDQMAEELSVYRGRSSTACPGPGDWLKAFGDGKRIFCITLTSNLSGSYNAACAAKEEYERQYPDRKVFVIDSLSAGPELRLIAEKLREEIKSGKSFREICDSVNEYMKSTALLFMLESMRNLANNGRVSHLTAKAAGILGIRVVGKASDVGTLEVLEKARGEKKALATLIGYMKKMGHRGGKVRISHCRNEQAAMALKELILQEFRSVSVEIRKCRALCSFYAEKGGMLVGFETCAE